MQKSFGEVAAFLDETLAEVKAERKYQYNKWNTNFDDDKWTAEDWAKFIDKYKANAAVAAVVGDNAEFMRQMIKVAALAVAAVEAVKRRDTISVGS